MSRFGAGVGVGWAFASWTTVLVMVALVMAALVLVGLSHIAAGVGVGGAGVGIDVVFRSLSGDFDVLFRSLSGDFDVLFRFVSGVGGCKCVGKIGLLRIGARFGVSGGGAGAGSVGTDVVFRSLGGVDVDLRFCFLCGVGVRCKGVDKIGLLRIGNCVGSGGIIFIS